MSRDTLQGLLESFAGGEPSVGGGRGSEGGITDNREPNFDRGSGRFHEPGTGEFEPGSPPPDLDTSTDRYRAKNGQFKESPNDLYDEPPEVKQDSLEPEG